MSTPMSRRAFARRTAGGVLAVGGLQLLLEACGAAAPASPTAAAPSAPIVPTSAPAPTVVPTTAPTAAAATAPTNAGLGFNISGKNAAVMPTYIPPKLPAPPDHHSPDPRITDGYDKYPANPAKSWTKDPPGLGSNVNVFIVAYYPPSTQYDDNPTWHEVNRQLNANVQFNTVRSADYPVKIGTIMAGNDLPDIIHVYNGISAAPNLPDFFKARCADLTPYLAGDAIKDYPNLAAIPTYAWFNSLSAIDGKLYQWPIHRYLPLLGNYVVSDVYDPKFGKGYVPHDLDDWNRMLRELNNPDGGMWAMGAAPGPPRFFGIYGYSAMFGAPNNWRLESDGKLVKDLETEEMKATIGWMRDTWQAGLWYPNSLQLSDSRTDGFVPGHYATTIEAFGNSWNDFWRRGLQLNPQRHFGFIPPFRANSSDPPQAFLTGGFISTNVMKQASPERIRELLRILDWLAAPFGTQEDMLLSYGLPGTDYTLDADSQPKPTPAGTTNAGYVPWRYMAQFPYVQYQADLPAYSSIMFDAETIQVKAGVVDPTLGYYSATNYAKGRLAEMNFRQAAVDIVVGRRPMSDYDQVITEWRNTGGEQSRKEYLDAFAANA
jgi:putative aldouronate transport system substrate-binding protein